MKFPRTDPGFTTVATIDIETTHWDPNKGEIVSIGTGKHATGEPARNATYETFHRDGSGEIEVIQSAINQLTEYEANGLVSYKGSDFDLDFISTRLNHIQEQVPIPEIAMSERHIDLFTDRKTKAERSNVKYPSLEESLDAYGYPLPVTVWRGQPVTNTRFGEELGPAYLEAIAQSTGDAIDFRNVIDHYLKTDLEANFALYYADIGRDFEPHLLDTERSFEV